jgi:hypothetical protein
MSRRYVIAPKRQARGRVDASWQRLLAQVPGLSVQGATPHRTQVEADPQAIQEAARLLGEDFLIEELAERGTD